jgi:hypothetical protein
MSPDNPYVLVFSVDGNGTVTLHYPADDGLVPQSKPGSLVLLPVPMSWTTPRALSVFSW